MIHKNLKEQLKEAMKEKDANRVSVIRDLLSSFTNEAVTLGKKPDEILDDETALKVIARKAKQRKDSIESFEKADRDDLVEKESKELKVLEEYLPEQLSDEEIEKIVDKKMEELGVSEKKDMGQLMGAVIKEAGNKADGGRVSKIVQSKLK
ncbi:MAG: GatB/YqeY domain-containing protein [Candidatus Paceibacterota bacterium]